MATVRDLSGNFPDSLPQGLDTHVSEVQDIKRTVAVVASDTVDIPSGPTDALIVTTSGAYKVTYANGLTDSPYLTAGLLHPISVKRVWSTGSVATAGISAGYESRV